MFVGFVLGVFVTLFVEVVGVLFALHWLNQKIKQKSNASDSATNPQPQLSLDSARIQMQGFVWVIESEKVALRTREQNLQKDDNNVPVDDVEVSPTRKHGIIIDNLLILRHISDPSQTTPISLKSCVIKAVSATCLPSQKWDKILPVKIESKSSSNSPIYNGSKTIYLYVESSLEKESWCNALRLASCEDKEMLNRFSKLNADFNAYLKSLNDEYYLSSLFMKPSLGFISSTNTAGSSSSSSSIAGQLWRKISRSRRAPIIKPNGIGNKEFNSSHNYRQSFRTNSTEEHMAFPLPQGSFPRSASHDIRSCGITNLDEGTPCWSILISRFFFHIKRDSGLKSSIQTMIQGVLSEMSTPNYIGEVNCSGIDIGNLPPYIHAVRLLPMDANGAWAFEVDVEYSDGIRIDFGTTVDVAKWLQFEDQDFQKIIVDTTNSIDSMSSDLLQERFGEHLNLPAEDDLVVDPKVDDLKGSKLATPMSRLKCFFNSMAQKAPQVPLSLSIKVKSLRGTLELYIKPPPSDQLWYGFTSMPEMKFDFNQFVGEYKIPLAIGEYIALFLIDQFQATIQETMVLPNRGKACIPFMSSAEKDDWVPRDVAPFIWLNHQEADHALSSTGDDHNKNNNNNINNVCESSNNYHAKENSTDHHVMVERESDSMAPKKMGKRQKIRYLGEKVGKYIYKEVIT